MKIIIAFTVLTLSFQCVQSQKIYQSHIIEEPMQTGFMYSKGITWIENKKQDSVLSIIIKGDTMTAVRNLLVYCLQVKDEADNANIMLSRVNLIKLQKSLNDKSFDYGLKEYNKAVSKNKLSWKKISKTY